MRLNNSKQVIDERRHRVAQLVVRGLTQREIVEELKRNGLTNPKTGQPFSLGIINLDIQALDAEWRASAAAEVAGHKGRMLLSLREVQRATWKLSDFANLLKALKQEADLLGLDEPVRIDLQMVQREAERLAAETGLDVRDILATAEEIVASTGAGSL